jgi:response regulator RpfG family c-di-GMP phosphodiesterase
MDITSGWPLKPGQDKAPVVAYRDPSPGGPGQTPSSRRVLVVDDLEDVRRLIMQVLGRRGYSLREADNGRAALASLQGQPVDLVITDLQMPEMGGLELLEQVKALFPDTDVILLTAYGTIQSAVQAIRNGAVDFVTKPFDIRELEGKVARCFEQRDQRAHSGSPMQPLVELNRLLSSQMDPAHTLEAIVELIQRTFAPDYIEVTLLEEALLNGAVLRRSGDLLAGCPVTNLSREEVLALAQREEAWILWHAGASGRGRPPEAGSALLAPLMRDQVVGQVLLLRKSGQPLFSRDQAQLLHIFASQIALSMLHARTQQQVAEAFRDLQHASLASVQTLVDALGTFDRYTQGHSERVSRYARELAMALEMPGAQVEAVTVAGLLHDLGKLGVGDNTLRKNGELTADEFDRVKLHPVMGAKILAGVEPLAHVVPLVLHHHEAVDGHGYPDGLAGDQIPLGARLLAVVDAYDSMITDRPYRAAMSRQEALARLASAAGTQLDGAMVVRWIQIADHANGADE